MVIPALYLMPNHRILIPVPIKGAAFIMPLHKAYHIVLVHIRLTVVAFVFFIICIIRTHITIRVHLISPFIKSTQEIYTSISKKIPQIKSAWNNILWHTVV